MFTFHIIQSIDLSLFNFFHWFFFNHSGFCFLFFLLWDPLYFLLNFFFMVSFLHFPLIYLEFILTCITFDGGSQYNLRLLPGSLFPHHHSSSNALNKLIPLAMVWKVPLSGTLVVCSGVSFMAGFSVLFICVLLFMPQLLKFYNTHVRTFHVFRDLLCMSFTSNSLWKIRTTYFSPLLSPSYHSWRREPVMEKIAVLRKLSGLSLRKDPGVLCLFLEKNIKNKKCDLVIIVQHPLNGKKWKLCGSEILIWDCFNFFFDGNVY